MSKPILCVDFDGVIHSYVSRWQGADVVSDPPVPGAIAWLVAAKEVFEVNIYSSRSSQPGGVQAMRNWLRSVALDELDELEGTDRFMAGIHFPEQKPAAFLTIDDRAICFHGNFSVLTPLELLNFKPWNKQGR